MALIEAVCYPLPEDIEKLKWYGAFDECLELIETRLQEDIPEALQRKLTMEKHQIRRMLRNYTVTPEAAIALLKERIFDFEEEELEKLRKTNMVDWIFVNGSVCYINSFFENLIKISPEYRRRQKNPEKEADGKRTNFEIRDEIIEIMKHHGSVTCRMKIGAKMELGNELKGSQSIYRVYLPLALENLQSKKVKFISASPELKLASPGDHPQRTVLFEGTANAVQKCEIVYQVENVVSYVDPDPDMVSEIQPDFYLQEQLPHISFTPYLKSVTEEVVGDETNPLLKARRIYDFITKNVTYSFMRSYVSLPVIPEYCLSRLRGDCGVQALTFITMCRIAGIPARWQSGLHADMQEAGCHDWAMFYVEPYGWLFTDCSYGGAAWREGKLDQWDFYFANIDPYRVVLASEFQHDFDPPMMFIRSDPYDNQTGEVECLDGPVDPDSFEGKVQVLEFELLAE